MSEELFPGMFAILKIVPDGFIVKWRNIAVVKLGGDDNWADPALYYDC